VTMLFAILIILLYFFQFVQHIFTYVLKQIDSGFFFFFFIRDHNTFDGILIPHSKKCWVVSTQFWVKYGQTQSLG